MGQEQADQVLTWARLLEQLQTTLPSDEEVSSKQLSDVLFTLHQTKTAVMRREKEKKREEELRRKQRQEEEEAARQEAHIREVTSMELPMDWGNAFDTDARAKDVHADSAADALILSLTQLGRVDMEYIAAVTGQDIKTVIGELKGAVYQNPDTWNECFYKGWETAEEYLSGNLMRKRKAAERATETYHGYFDDNIKAIDAVLPDPVAAKNIYVTLGSPWVPADVIDDFVTHILRLSSDPFTGTTHDELTGSWEIPRKSGYWYCHGLDATHTYGTPRLTALYILERTLNMKTVQVTDEVPSATAKSGKKRVVNKTETLAALEKQEKMVKEFQRWVWKDPARRERLEILFENKYGCVRRRHFDGSFLTFPTMSPSVSLYPYQKNAVARILFSPNTLLAHDVGSGKTYIMIAAGMELRRMGLSKKNLYVVPNNIVGQWKSMFETMYPTAKLLCVEPRTFTPQKREAMLECIRDEDYDGIIMAYSCFEQIPLSKDYYIEELEKKKKLIEKAIGSGKLTAKLCRKQRAVNEALEQLENAMEEACDAIGFDELGVTRLFLDEAHNYKNVPLETQVDKVLGIHAAGSKKCKDMLDKVHMTQRLNDGGGVVLATGTPITNSITDAYVMQQYLQSGELALLDLQTFDSWIGMFAERVTEFEIDVDTTNYRLATRFAKFHNLPELTSLLSSIADFHSVDVTDGVPLFEGHTDVLVPKTAAFETYLQDIARRADHVRQGIVPRTDDNLLKITGDGRKAALDLRLVEPQAAFRYESKVAQCAERVWEIYHRTAAQNSTQLVFCDTSTPKSGFNMYDELKGLLVSMGLPEETIAFVHDADTEKQRAALFSRVRKGEIRVLIGSTFKLGLGVNVQDKLIAVHHLDVPWRPADMTQREGRILRQGNENRQVNIFRYITEGSFDAYSWQLLETKQRFITGLLSGSMQARSGGDIDNTVLSYAEVKALAVGNPLIKERVETANELTRVMALQHKANDDRLRLEQERDALPDRCRRQDACIAWAMEDAAYYREHAVEHTKTQRKVIRERIFEAIGQYELMPHETVLLQYQGFDVILPSNMTASRPYVWLSRRGRYYVELGDAKAGALVRIDHVLNTLDRHIAMLQEDRRLLAERQQAVEKALRQRESYAGKVERLLRRLEQIDKKLGVDQL